MALCKNTRSCYNAGMNTTRVPLEEYECIKFSQWLTINKIPHTHIANESRSGTRSAMIRNAKLKRMGQSRGVWDYEIYVPIKGITGAVDSYELVKIEMKRIKGGTVSAEQKQWQKIYEKAGIYNKICYGANDAIDYIKSIMYINK